MRCSAWMRAGCRGRSPRRGRRRSGARKARPRSIRRTLALVDGRPQGHAGRQVLERERIRIDVVGVEELDHPLADQLRTRQPEELERRAVAGQDPSALIEDHDPVRGLLHERPVLTLALAEGLLGSDPIGDVPHRRVDPDDAVLLCIDDGAHRTLDESDAHARKIDPELPPVAAAIERMANVLHREGAILRNEVLIPGPGVRFADQVVRRSRHDAPEPLAGPGSIRLHTDHEGPMHESFANTSRASTDALARERVRRTSSIATSIALVASSEEPMFPRRGGFGSAGACSSIGASRDGADRHSRSHPSGNAGARRFEARTASERHRHRRPGLRADDLSRRPRTLRRQRVGDRPLHRPGSRAAAGPQGDRSDSGTTKSSPRPERHETEPASRATDSIVTPQSARPRAIAAATA